MRYCSRQYQVLSKRKTLARRNARLELSYGLTAPGDPFLLCPQGKDPWSSPWAPFLTLEHSHATETFPEPRDTLSPIDVPSCSPAIPVPGLWHPSLPPPCPSPSPNQPHHSFPHTLPPAPCISLISRCIQRPDAQEARAKGKI